MKAEILKSKLHNATVTGADINYQGSISLDPELCHGVGLMQWEKVDVLSISTGARFTTYVIFGGPGEVCLNGAAARLVQAGDRVIVVSYAMMSPKKAATHRPRVAILGEKNQILRVE